MTSMERRDIWPIPPSPERRRHARFDGNEYPLRIGRRRARLLDWSASGIGIEVKDGIAGFALGDTVELGILSDQTHAVMMFAGRILRIDPERGLIGLELLDGADAVVPLLVEMLG
jgi:PilZ domain